VRRRRRRGKVKPGRDIEIKLKEETCRSQLWGVKKGIEKRGC